MKTRRIDHILLWVAMLAFAHHLMFAQNSEATSNHSDSHIGILLMAHGGSKDWNAKVESVASDVDKQIPAEVAFGMADRSTLQAGVDKLVARGVKQIIAVPLFISSHSGVIEATKYLLGVRPDAPKDMNDYVMVMSPEMHSKHESAMPTSPPEASKSIPEPVRSPIPVRMTAALDQDPLVAAILSDHAAAMAKKPKSDVVVLVAHGPNDDATNTQWLADMQSLARQIAAHAAYAHVDCVTLRDDADAPVREAATAELRKVVQTADDAGYHVLIVPLLLSYGGIENGARQRLDGIEHTFSSQALLPDPRIAQWVLQRARVFDIPSNGF